MSCRSNPGSSAITSYARATSGLADVQTQNFYHRLVGEGRAGGVQPPSGQELAAWLREVTSQVQTANTIGEVQRQRILNRLNNLGDYTPDGPTFYAWQNIGQRAREGQAALNQTYGLLCMAGGLTPEQGATRVQELTGQFDRGEVARNWQPPVELLARLGEWQGYQMGNSPFYGTRSLPQDRRTQYVLATLATEARVLPGQRPTAGITPANCPDCGQFRGTGGHNCPVLALQSEDAAVRSAAAGILVEIGAAAGPAVPALIQVLRDDRDVGVRCQAARALGRIGNPAAIASLTNALDDTDPAVCVAAIRALSRIGGPSAVASLTDALNDTRRFVRLQAGEALRQLANNGATPVATQAQTVPTVTTNHCPDCGQFRGEGNHDCPAAVVLTTTNGTGTNRRTNSRTLGEMLDTEEGRRTLHNLADSENRPGQRDLITHRNGVTTNYSELARQLLAGRAALAADHAEATPAQAAPVPTTPGQLPPPDPASVWSELYQTMPETDPTSLNAPSSTYQFKPVTTPLNTRQGEVANFNELNNENWRTNGLQNWSTMGADCLYDYQRRRLRFQADRLNGLQNYALSVRNSDTPQVEWAYQQLAEGMREYQKRRLQLNQMQRERQLVGYPVGADPDENEEGLSADYALNQWLSSRPDIPQASGQGLVWNRPEPEPHFDLPNYPPPSTEQAEPLYFRVREGQGEGLRRSVAQSGLPVIVADANTPIPAGAIVVNWGDYEWEETGQYAIINSAESVSVARDKLASLEKLRELAPASTTRPAEAVARFGPVFAGKGRTGQSGSGKAILQNPPGGPADRPLGNLSASAVSGYDYYQEYLPQRTEYRALVLGGEVIALYKRVPQGVEPGQLRPDNFEYQPLPTIGQRQLEASQTAMDRVGLDFGGVDLVEDTATGRLMVLEVNSAPGLGQESLERLYRAALAQLHSPEEE